jgi:hypothetical protein
MKFYSPIKLIVVPFFLLYLFQGIAYSSDKRINNLFTFPLRSLDMTAVENTDNYEITAYHFPILLCCCDHNVLIILRPT